MTIVPQDQQARELEQAWRNGWGSALNFLRAADDLAQGREVPEGNEAAQAIIRDLVGKWVAIIDGLTEDAVGRAREIGFAEPSAPEGTA